MCVLFNTTSGRQEYIHIYIYNIGNTVCSVFILSNLLVHVNSGMYHSMTYVCRYKHIPILSARICWVSRRGPAALHQCKFHYQLYRRVRGTRGRFEYGPAFEPRPDQSVASRNTDFAIRAVQVHRKNFISLSIPEYYYGKLSVFVYVCTVFISKCRCSYE